jgi:hypothetical protein
VPVRQHRDVRKHGGLDRDGGAGEIRVRQVRHPVDDADKHARVCWSPPVEAREMR